MGHDILSCMSKHLTTILTLMTRIEESPNIAHNVNISHIKSNVNTLEPWGSHAFPCQFQTNSSALRMPTLTAKSLLSNRWTTGTLTHRKYCCRPNEPLPQLPGTKLTTKFSAQNLGTTPFPFQKPDELLELSHHLCHWTPQQTGRLVTWQSTLTNQLRPYPMWQPGAGLLPGNSLCDSLWCLEMSLFYLHKACPFISYTRQNPIYPMWQPGKLLKLSGSFRYFLSPISSNSQNPMWQPVKLLHITLLFR